MFREELNNELLNVDLKNAESSEFTETFMSLLDKHALKKQKYIRANNANFMKKNLRKAIILSSKLRNRFLKEKTDESKSLNKQRNICVSLLRKTIRNYYAQQDNKNATENRKFWKAVSPLISEKTLRKESIILKEHAKTITDNKKIAETFNNFFSNIVKNLNIDSDLSDITSQTNNADPVFRVFEEYANHPSVFKIKRKMSDKGLNLSLKYVTRNKIAKEIQNLAKKFVRGVTYL